MAIRALYICIIPLIFFASGMSHFLPAQDDVAAALYQEGLKKYILEDYLGALKDFESALKLNPDNEKFKKMHLNTLIKKGNREYEREDLAEAEYYFSRAYRLSGQDVELKAMLDSIRGQLRLEKERTALKQDERLEIRAEQPSEAENTKVQIPFDMDAFIQQQYEENRILLDEILATQQQEREALLQNIEENQRIIDESIRNQKGERELLLQNIMEISRNQNEDRKLFSRTLMILVGGSIFIALIIFFGFILLLKRRTIPQGNAVLYEAPPALERKPQALLEYADRIDESKYITDDRYSDMVQAKQLGHLYGELKEGNLSWETLQGYISELNHEMKSSILSIVEEKLKSGDVSSNRNAMDILLPFLTDGESDINTASQHLLTDIVRGTTPALPEESTEDPLGYNALLQFAHMVDEKTGRLNHSIHVAVIAEKMASALNDPELDPDTVKSVGLVHDIGYLELDDRLLRKEGKLTERQFNIIKTHTDCGLHLLKHVDLPKIFVDGIMYHHERLDGSGYPKGLQSDRIPKIARLLGVADFFDAVTSLRPHRPARNIDSGIKMIEELAGDVFDPHMFKLLAEIYRDKMDDEA